MASAVFGRLSLALLLENSSFNARMRASAAMIDKMSASMTAAERKNSARLKAARAALRDQKILLGQFQSQLLKVAATTAIVSGAYQAFIAVVRKGSQDFREFQKETAALDALMGAASGTADDMFQSFSRTNKEIREFMPADVVARFRQFIQAGYSADRIAEATASTLNAVTASMGRLDLKKATELNITLERIFGGGGSFGGQMDIALKAANQFPISVDQIADAMGYAAEASAVWDQSLQSTTIMLGNLIPITRTASKGGTAYRNALLSLSKPKTIEFLEKMGISLRDTTGDFRDAYQVLLDINDQFDIMAEKDKKFGTNTSAMMMRKIGGVRGGATFAAIKRAPDTTVGKGVFAGESAASARAAYVFSMHALSSAGGETARLAEEARKTSDVINQEFITSLRKASIEIGRAFTPMTDLIKKWTTSILDAMTGGLKAFAGHTGGRATLTGASAGMGAGIYGAMGLGGGLLLSFMDSMAGGTFTDKLVESIGKGPDRKTRGAGFGKRAQAFMLQAAGIADAEYGGQRMGKRGIFGFGGEGKRKNRTLRLISTGNSLTAGILKFGTSLAVSVGIFAALTQAIGSLYAATKEQTQALYTKERTNVQAEVRTFQAGVKFIAEKGRMPGQRFAMEHAGSMQMLGKYLTSRLGGATGDAAYTTAVDAQQARAAHLGAPELSSWVEKQAAGTLGGILRTKKGGKRLGLDMKQAMAMLHLTTMAGVGSTTETATQYQVKAREGAGAAVSNIFAEMGVGGPGASLAQFRALKEAQTKYKSSPRLFLKGREARIKKLRNRQATLSRAKGGFAGLMDPRTGGTTASFWDAERAAISAELGAISGPEAGLRKRLHTRTEEAKARWGGTGGQQYIEPSLDLGVAGALHPDLTGSKEKSVEMMGILIKRLEANTRAMQGNTNQMENIQKSGTINLVKDGSGGGG